jgi:hypothetical protein
MESASAITRSGIEGFRPLLLPILRGPLARAPQDEEQYDALSFSSP